MSEELRPFELEIAMRMRTFGKIATSPTGEWIKNHLLDVRMDWVYRMWRRYQRFIEIVRELGIARIPEPSYNSFKRYVQLLRKLGLITVIEQRPTRYFPQGKPRTYYVVVREKLDDPAWKHAYQALYPVTSTRWRRQHGLPVGRRARRGGG